MDNPFTKHPKAVKKTYLEHFWFAVKLSAVSLKISVASLVHAFFPFLFQETASSAIKKISKRLGD